MVPVLTALSPSVLGVSGQRPATCPGRAHAKEPTTAVPTGHTQDRERGGTYGPQEEGSWSLGGGECGPQEDGSVLTGRDLNLHLSWKTFSHELNAIIVLKTISSPHPSLESWFLQDSS